MKLLLQGKTKNEGGDDPYPVVIAGIGKPIPSNKVEDYLGEEFEYYYGIYKRHKHLGAPYPGGWTEYPDWYCQLVITFDQVFEDEDRSFQIQMASAGLGGFR